MTKKKTDGEKQQREPRAPSSGNRVLKQAPEDWEAQDRAAFAAGHTNWSSWAREVLEKAARC